MSAFLPQRARGAPVDAEHSRLLEEAPSREERKARWAVRAAQWRARELAQAVFGDVTESSLRAPRVTGAARGLLLLGVPFRDLETHREREARFMAAADADPILSQIPLVYVFGPDHG